VQGPPAPETVTIVAYDPGWPDRYRALAADVRAGLGVRAQDLEHVGSHLGAGPRRQGCNRHRPHNRPELVRHRRFRDWLTAHPEDRDLYERAKRAAATCPERGLPGGGTVMDYNRRKEAVVREIYDRAFREAGLL
jgi:GrpB-like predicted nucleotidyltransferase (UPF0157 family)